MTGSLVIIESPYAGDVEANVAYARQCMRDALDRGEHPIASHLLYTQPGILDDDVPAERARGIEAGLAWRRVAERAVFYVDRGISNGMLMAWQTYHSEDFPHEVRWLGLTNDLIRRGVLSQVHSLFKAYDDEFFHDRAAMIEAAAGEARRIRGMVSHERGEDG